MQTTDTGIALDNNLNIGFIGGSKAGTSIANYFAKSGLNIVGFYSHNYESAIVSAKITQTKSFISLKSLIDESNLIFISVQDKYILEIWQQIIYFNLTNKIICHLSGHLSSNIFSNYTKYKCFVASVHVPISFSVKNDIPKELKSAYFILEGDVVALNKIQKILAITKNEFILLTPRAKINYHIACVMASSLTLSLLDLASNLLLTSISCNQQDITQKIILNLANSAISNALNLGKIDLAITGPLIRTENDILNQHMDSIENLRTKNLYRELSIHLLEIIDLDENVKKSLENIFVMKENTNNV